MENFTSADVIRLPLENFPPLRRANVWVFLSVEGLSLVYRHCWTPLPFRVTVYSGSMICSKIQMDSLSNTVVLFIDCESAVRAMTRFPPRAGAAPVPDDVDVPDDPPQAARTIRAPAAIRARAVVVRYVTVAPCG